MPINDTYVVPEHVINFLCSGERSFLALRLVHGLLYALDTAVRGNMSLVPARFSSEHGVRTSTIAAAVGPAKAKDNRWIHDACAELTSQGILKTHKIQGRVFRFELTPSFSASFSRKTKAFAIMTTEQVRQCRTVHDLFLMSLSCLHRGKDRPKFLLPRVPLHLEPKDERFQLLPQKPPEQDPWRRTWGDSSRAWTNAAIRVSSILGLNYLLAPRQDMIDDFVSEVAVKIQHDRTAWERGKLYKFPPGTRSVIEVQAGGRKSVLNGEAVQNKWHQTIIR